MKKALLIIGIILIVIGALSLLIGGFFGYVSNHTMDGSAGLYQKQRMTMIILLASGVVALVVGILCLVLRGRAAA